MAATGTGYFFSSGEHARADRFNLNFSLIGFGDIIPLSPSTFSGVTNTYDFGTSDHRWLTHNIKSLNLKTSTSTAALVVEQNTAITTGSLDFKIGSTIAASFRVDGINRYSFAPKPSTLTVGSVFLSASISSVGITSTGYITLGAVDVKCKGGMMEISLIPAGQAYISFELTVPGGFNFYMAFEAYRNTTTTIVWSSRFERNGALGNAASPTTSAFAFGSYPVDMVRFFDSPGAGTHRYSIIVKEAGSSYNIYCNGFRFMAKEF